MTTTTTLSGTPTIKPLFMTVLKRAYMPTSEIWMWSSSKRSSVVYTPADEGEDASTTIKVMVESNQTFDSTFASATSTKFKGRWSGNHGDLDALPYTYAKWSDQGYELSNDGGNTRNTYHYTGTTPGGTFEPYTLYLDDGNGELSANDKPVRFDFAINEKKTKYLDFTTDETGSYEELDAWPAEGLDLILASEDVAGEIVIQPQTTFQAVPDTSGILERFHGIMIQQPLMQTVPL